MVKNLLGFCLRVLLGLTAKARHPITHNSPPQLSLPCKGECRGTAEEPWEEDRSPRGTATWSLWTLAGHDPVSSVYKMGWWASAEPHEMAVRTMKETLIGPQSSLLKGQTAGGKPRKTSAWESRPLRLPDFLPQGL